MLGFLFSVVLTIVFAIVALRIASSVRKEASVFREFAQSSLLGPAVLLFPLGPMILWAGAQRFGFFALALGAICYLPGLILSNRSRNAFERVGNIRANEALEASHSAFVASACGLGYVVLVLIVSVASVFVAPDA